ncbi:glycoside hydrolase family 15 protein [Pedobacter sp. SYSU D00535]|uniref:glycoside hydrolase family 15 protein n=1 Tax=Pedobacter sp. SYSU D00535 TaxID=2810308 RepID=UPI001A974E82|nr:glycoside hydrolase family 15 protein [Pedobacter sp. SYSU D00535]
MSYQPIENYGVIGDLNTVALVGLNGSIDFMCFPDFDSPTIFAAILDENKGGAFKIYPESERVKHKQLYLPDTNVLLTRFLSSEGVAELTDFMPVEELYGGKELIRRVTCIQGEFNFNVECSPRFDYARAEHTAELINDYEVVFRSTGPDKTSIRLKSTVPLKLENTDVVTAFRLKKGEKADFLFEHLDCKSAEVADMESFITQSLFDTIKYWKDWVEKSNYKGRWMEIVNRSALCLKLMTSYNFGSMVAAPTFGLPEEIEGERNWDYRYTWIRDASFTVYAFLKLGYRKEARDFINWIEKQCKDIAKNDEYLSLMYALNGEKELIETELRHLEGYKRSAPVRIGNGAYTQIQLDIYGELLDSVYLYDKKVEPIAYRFWKDLSRHVDWVCDNWQRSDEGIWEVRGGKKEFLYSRMMCWVAIDRGVKIAQKHSYPLSDRWIQERDNIFNSIHVDFWDEELQAFVQYKGAKTVDAATLLMPMIRFIGPKDPQWLSTLKLIEEKLVSDFLVYRYRPNEAFDGLTGGEGTFSMCTFWYVECLSMAGELTKARLYFEKMLGYANHVGLYAEMLGLQGEHLGNFPQAFTHLGLISAALHLDKQLDDQWNKEIRDGDKRDVSDSV